MIEWLLTLGVLALGGATVWKAALGQGRPALITAGGALGFLILSAFVGRNDLGLQKLAGYVIMPSGLFWLFPAQWDPKLGIHVT